MAKLKIQWTQETWNPVTGCDHVSMGCDNCYAKPMSNRLKNILEKYKNGFEVTEHWEFSGVRQNEHIAMFPKLLPHRLIKMYSFVGETVLDPFLGSGTTAIAAKKLNRNSIGYEINKDFVPILENKLEVNNLNIYNDKFYFH